MSRHILVDEPRNQEIGKFYVEQESRTTHFKDPTL